MKPTFADKKGKFAPLEKIRKLKRQAEYYEEGHKKWYVNLMNDVIRRKAQDRYFLYIERLTSRRWW